MLWPGPLFLRCPSNLGRSGPEPATGEDTCIVRLGFTGKLRKGIRPRARKSDEKPRAEVQGKGPKEGNDGGQKKAISRRDGNNSESGHGPAEKSNGSSATNSDDELDQRILGMEKAVGTAFYRNILREYGRVNQPTLIRDAAVKQKVLLMLESVTRGIDRLEAVLKRIDPNTVQALLTKLQVSSLGQIADIKTLQNVVLGLEEVARSNPPYTA